MEVASPDDIAACCLSQYDQLPSKGTKPGIRSDGKHEWTILAGAVIEIDGGCNCVSLCTGVKALPYIAISPKGDLLHDSHAEILARRGARTWLLKRLVSEVKADQGSANVDGLARIFSQSGDVRWSMNPGIKLHMYCSSFPCGDASSSVLLRYGTLARQDQAFAHLQGSESRILRGRTSMSDSRLHLRTKPGKLQSLPSISMSCTDKMAMWSAVGMQGSLLSRWLEPIFFDRLIVGIDSIADDASPSTVMEAIQDCQTILHRKLGQDDSTAFRPLQVNSTALPFVHSKEKVQARLSANSADGEEDAVPAAGSIVWIRDEKKEHIIQGRKQGIVVPKDKTVGLPPSQRSILSKASFFELVKEAQLSLVGNSEGQADTTYFQAKHRQIHQGQKKYREYKDRLRGSKNSSAQQEMVTSFLTTIARRTGKTESESVKCTRSPSPSAPFYGWLVSGESSESFQ